MKKLFLLFVFAGFALGAMAQSACYWVFLTDKDGTTFDPYTYFDAKAIERYQQCGANLYDWSNYPVKASYVQQVEAIAEEGLGQSRWMNATAVMATPDQIEAIQALQCVSRVVMLNNNWTIASKETVQTTGTVPPATEAIELTDQLIRMGGDQFKKQGIDGTGMRIAVFDAGFPHVNTHMAFKHLRDNNRILKTWNFPLKKEDVYGWGSHGTMVLSCITGQINGKQLGLATGAEFLLARTEIDAEPFKEEVWWMQAMEWADKNGANIISSSLGYGKDRHYTKDMDGTSYVAKAANMAARKGMLVCNSAGNEGDDSKWKTIITPADADSVICVGGIEDRLDVYHHISFSSFGPSADGRLKPNVCAFGHAVVAKHNDDTSTTSAYGTSFSCPLTSGFVACAWQTRPGLTAMQMKEEIEKSADLYPYYDYAFGYGVPQASYFLSNDKQTTEPTFRFEDKDFYIAVVPIKHKKQSSRLKFEENSTQKKPTSINPTIFFKTQNKNGSVDKFYAIESDVFDSSRCIAIRKNGLYKNTLVVHYDGYTESFNLSDHDIKKIQEKGNMDDFDYSIINQEGYFDFNYEESMNRSIEDNKVNEHPWKGEFGANFGAGVKEGGDVYSQIKPYSYYYGIDFRFIKPIRKWYSLGFAISENIMQSNLNIDSLNCFDNLYNSSNANATANLKRKSILQEEIGIELFQRIYLRAGGQFHWDLGVFGCYSWDFYQVRYNKASEFAKNITIYNPMGINSLNYGATTRFNFGRWSIFARYRLTNIWKQTDNSTINNESLPRLTVGFGLKY